MRIARRVILSALIVLLVAAAWVWWNRPVRVDMAAYVPADSVVYLEANSLPELLSGITSTGAWRELAPAAGVNRHLGSVGWASRFVTLTGLGPSETVVFSRAQVAVTVQGFEAAEESDTELKFSPRAALVAETHTGEGRARAALEKLVGDFARRSFGSPSVERKEVDGFSFMTWAAPSGGRRKIVTAVEGSVAVVGNDEAAVRACLEVRRGARPSLAGNEQLEQMRSRLGAGGALAFGFAPAGSAAKMFEVFAPLFVAGVSDKAEVQGFLATFLPQLVNQLMGSAGWSARVVEGRIEDHYFLRLPEGVPERLSSPFEASGEQAVAAPQLFPRDVYQVSRYRFRDPEAAWRGLNAIISSRVDAYRASIISLALEALLKPYGVERPREFLRAAGPEVITARLESTSENKVLVVGVRDRAALRREVAERLGRGARAERVGDEELLISSDAEQGAASFVGDYLLVGDEEDLRRCLAARLEERAGDDEGAADGTSGGFFKEPTFAVTRTRDAGAARTFVSLFGGARKDASRQEALEKALARHALSVSETRLTPEGFEKKTRSAFGQFGELGAMLAPGN
ncbi:MAG TPA: hypothetical protein VFS10_05705 [Pyrinomonadaceae bacterium]|nr:hypothetical protein [Pyrinomonadaceae bacterium]